MTSMWKMFAVAGASVAATAAVGALALTTMGGPHFGPLRGVDANGDGQVTRAEWLAAANARFAALDTNRDGSLAVGELPRPRPPGGRHGRPHEWADGPDDDASTMQSTPTPEPAPVTNMAR